MPDHTTVTKSEFMEAITAIGQQEGGSAELAGLYCDSPANLRKEMEPVLLEALRRTAESGEVDYYEPYEALIKVADLPVAIHVEAAIIVSMDGLTRFDDIFGREGLSSDDIARITEGCINGMDSDVANGWVDNVLKILSLEGLSAEQRRVVEASIVCAIEEETEEGRNYEQAALALVHPKVSDETRKIALDNCVENGGFSILYELLKSGNAPESIRDEIEARLPEALMSIERFCAEEKVLMVLEASKEEDSLPENVRGLIRPALIQALGTYSIEYPRAHVGKFLETEGMSPTARAALEEYCTEHAPAKKATPVPKPSSLDIAKMYLEQIKDQGTEGVMKGKAKAPASVKSGPARLKR